MLKEILLRMVIGGTFVSAFAVIGDIFKPKSFAGLFGAAPSIALATLALTVGSSGKLYAAIEARSMIAGAVGFLAYACSVRWGMLHYKLSALTVTFSLLIVWGAVTLFVWFLWLRSA
jgi:hypothetical protein